MGYQKLQYGKAKAVTLSDTDNIYYSTPGDNAGCTLYIGNDANVKVKTISGDEVVFAKVKAGTILPVQVLRVFSTGTTTPEIVALW
jgi:hypothetical protein